MHERSKNQNAKIVSNGCLNMHIDERIPNLVSEFKMDKIWHPFWPKKTVGNWQIPDLANFDSFLAKKEVNSYPIWIMRPDLESSHHFAYLRHPFDMIFAFWFFDLPCIFENLKLNSRPLKVLKIDFFVHPWTKRVWNHGKPLDLLSISRVGVFEQPYCAVCTQNISQKWAKYSGDRRHTYRKQNKK